jgi:hypothetical protein
LVASIAAEKVVRLRARRDGRRLDLWIGCDAECDLWRATAPGAPGRGDATFIIIRSAQPAGMLRAVWSWNERVRSVELFPNVVTMLEDERHGFTATPGGVQVTINVGDARSTIDLAAENAAEPEVETFSHRTDIFVGEGFEDRAAVLKPGRPISLRLAAESYRQSEDTWEDAGKPTATITLGNDRGELAIDVDVSNVDLSFVESGAINRLDNEHADINGAGIQLYLRPEDSLAGYVLVPVSGTSEVNIRPIDGWGDAIPISATWTKTRTGYAVRIRVPGAANDSVIDLDIIVNEKPSGRERRRGQLILSGGAGEFVYLRGDRHDPDRLIPFLLTNA